MNYRHIYHAGNFADVLKHIVLARLVAYLKGKDKAFRVIDTHAGIGLYDLTSDEAQRTGEWIGGIGRLLDADVPAEIAPLIAPYLDQVRALNPKSGVTHYPGSPKIARMLFRPQDRLSAIELHPLDAETLRSVFAGDFQTRVIALDGWLALGAHVPPKEKRGLVLIDPPFEQDGEFERMTDGLARALRRWRGGTYCLWYPLKEDAAVEAFHRRIEALGMEDVLCAELWVRDPRTEKGLNGSGLVIVNPPFTLEGELDALLPWLTNVLAEGDGAGFRLKRLQPVTASPQQ
ncbi:23S rRNA (adenine(2030)-N(6))-methyltransferase RlmJ [Georhizobium profundi]|uniref:Ribosomal RNA large subunit methyltransferase J n=1 Tax=Georhizobium profundi TaxID=2341112 RepID=A0A3Q8XPR4_9HYPH|nr:23S rRNA (adenine(2030)-N(6))-methyltransferase RlmJ [Georhizobium profundi]AZN72425.1 23S rRNA (adenine(2030)-N(6))-methyltransferase RlmJ [Georhizobium profundi]